MIWFVEDSEIYLFSVKDDKFYSGIFQKLFSMEKTRESFDFGMASGAAYFEIRRPLSNAIKIRFIRFWGN